jgi:hypothetical protein
MNQEKLQKIFFTKTDKEEVLAHMDWHFKWLVIIIIISTGIMGLLA